MIAPALRELVDLLARLPGVGERTAQRYAFALLESDSRLADALGKSISAVHSKIQQCERCCTYTEATVCELCQNTRRDPKTLCVVARVQDQMAFERSGAYRGLYHVLHGLLSPLDGQGPETLRVEKLQNRLQSEPIEELIIATPLSVDGDATALFLAESLRSYPVRISRIASGVPHGGELEFTDQVTLGRALGERKMLRDSPKTTAQDPDVVS